MKTEQALNLGIVQTNNPIYRVTNWDTYQQYKKTSKRYVRQQPWFKFYARELLHQREFVMLPSNKFKFLVLLMCYASQDDGYLPFDDLVFHFRGMYSNDEINKNIEYFVSTHFIYEVDNSEFIDSRSYGWHRENKPSSTTYVVDKNDHEENESF